MKTFVLTWMRLEAEHCVHNREVNRTQLAENAAHAFDHDEWLDDPDHFVWELAQKAGFDYEHEHGTCTCVGPCEAKKSSLAKL